MSIESILNELNEALLPSNARKFDGDNNYKKCLDLRVSVVGDENGDPAFVLEAKSPRSSVNNLGLSVTWSTNSRAEAVALLRNLISAIENE